MAIRKILVGDEPTLYKKCRPVERFDERLHLMLDDIAQTMYDADGVGLAAPQVGILRRIFVVDCGEGLFELINPVVVATEGEIGEMEACLSFPGQQGYVVRPERVVMRAQNRSGEWIEYEGHGLLARALLHENDHLDGQVYLRLVTEPPEGFGEEEDDEGTDEQAQPDTEAAQ